MILIYLGFYITQGCVKAYLGLLLWAYDDLHRI